MENRARVSNATSAAIPSVHVVPSFGTIPTVVTYRVKRLARKTICFSKSEWMHDIVIGLFINRDEFGLAV